MAIEFEGLRRPALWAFELQQRHHWIETLIRDAALHVVLRAVDV
jgi:hypothetical protein